jgi:hypothetical protein
MIDATKLVHGHRYYIRTKDSWQEVRWLNTGHVFFEREIYAYYEPAEVTAAIPIPSPETLSEMWRVVQNVAYPDGLTDSPSVFELRIYDRAIHDLARKLQEKRV